ncbi:hypothetical protein EON79_13135 [bacterium]|nr:MAG: hypothetical protein EON79_13135 [bacterium]
MADLVPGRTIFANVRWMEFYAGSEKDLPAPNFRFLRRTGLEGAERFNMKPFNGRCFAYVPFNRTLKLARIDPTATGNVVEGVTVVMTATMPGGGSSVVGWYENASVHSTGFRRPNGGETDCKISAEASDAYLVPADRRGIIVDRGGVGEPGTSAVTYITSLNPTLERRVLAEIAALKRTGLRSVAESEPSEGLKKRLYQTDPELRMKVEQAAVRRVGSYYATPSDHGSGAVPDPWRSVERENLGWDLATESGLRIEVKGRHARSFTAELTPNEYKAFLKAETDPAAAATYRLAIVAGALDDDPDMAIFGFVDGAWTCERSARRLGYEERPGARVGMESDPPATTKRQRRRADI